MNVDGNLILIGSHQKEKVIISRFRHYLYIFCLLSICLSFLLEYFCSIRIFVHLALVLVLFCVVGHNHFVFFVFAKWYNYFVISVRSIVFVSNWIALSFFLEVLFIVLPLSQKGNFWSTYQILTCNLQGPFLILRSRICSLVVD